MFRLVYWACKVYTKPVITETINAKFHATEPDLVAVARIIIENDVPINTVLIKLYLLLSLIPSIIRSIPG